MARVRKGHRRGEQHQCCKVPDWKVKEIRQLREGEVQATYNFLAWLYGLPMSTIRDIITYRTRWSPT